MAFMLFMVLMAIYVVFVNYSYYEGGDVVGENWNSGRSIDYQWWSIGVGDSIRKYTSPFVAQDGKMVKCYNCYDPGFSNDLVQVRGISEYDSCNTENPIATYTSGEDNITIKHPGHYFFICGFDPDHCKLRGR
ncbi:OLC1v1007300C1 [Oldenlandia corymbosa var. corymbosa]|uniref:OLC1v1007300C1 n=1 Tax=Oldenlandia corymbosa var. corymbosa TaxID=529605 RepID=A0AAV1DMA7_OLDCO|nr:OLC1v1007300C1 [Oldenlandia corymbosa var. corymbosa]